MTKRKALVLLLLVACIAIVGLVVTTGKHPEPTYNGRPLSEWLDQTRSDIDYTQRVHAVQQIGTNALPLLLEWIQSQPSPLEIRVRDWIAKLHINPYYKYARRRQDAVAGFAALGDEAKPAIPALVFLVDSTNSINQFSAIQGLAAIGKTTLPILVDIVTNSLAYTNGNRPNIAAAFWALQTNAFPAEPALIAHIRDPNLQVADTAIDVLGIFGAIQESKDLPPETTADIVQALRANLDTTDSPVLLHTIRALTHFGANARPAVPALLQKLTSTNQQLRAAARAALRKIDPQALARAQKP